MFLIKSNNVFFFFAGGESEQSKGKESKASI